MLKKLSSLELNKFPEVNGCHFVTRYIGTDRCALLIVGKTPKTIKVIPLEGKCVKGGNYSDRQEYEFYYNDENMNNKDSWERLYQSRKNPDEYVCSWSRVVLSEEPHEYYDFTF